MTDNIFSIDMKLKALADSILDINERLEKIEKHQIFSDDDCKPTCVEEVFD